MVISGLSVLARPVAGRLHPVPLSRRPESFTTSCSRSPSGHNAYNRGGGRGLRKGQEPRWKRREGPQGPGQPGNSEGRRPFRGPPGRREPVDEGREPPRPADFFAASSFEDLGASEDLIRALSKTGVTRPSHIQAAAWNAVTASPTSAFLLADHAGSGKTLAYLLPLVQRLKEEEQRLGLAAVTRTNSPRVLILVPTTELCRQVVGVCRRLSGAGFPLRITGLTTSAGKDSQLAQLAAGVDVAVGTPARVAGMLEDGSLGLAALSCLVLDEVDVLLGNTTFPEQVEASLAAPGASDAGLVVVTASLPGDLHDALLRRWPGLRAVTGPGLHRPAAGVEERLLDCSGGEEVSEESGFARKADALARLLAGSRAARTIVFCNKVEGCRAVENFLKRRERAGGARVLPYHTAIAPPLRKANLRAFLAAPGGGEGEVPLVLLATDRASRGIDSGLAEHVVLFDFPRDPSEYIRRVGRTGRGPGGTGLVSVLVLGRQVKLAQAIMNRNRKGFPLYDIPA
ncbi:hypothetical protein ACKKBG_A37610 [Auxenochlorella protothecoides x Auxenochlorella symbiontica]